MDYKPFRVKGENIFFDNAILAQEYAKAHPGVIIVRNNDFTISSNAKVITKQKLKIKKEPKIKTTPKVIYDYLNSIFPSHEKAKKELSLQLYYHMLNKEYPNKKELKSSSIMLIGPTGSGKTFMIQKLSEFLDIEFIKIDASSLVPEGIVGIAVGDIIRMINDKIEDSKNRKFCIVYFDEIDKLLLNQNGTYSKEIISQLLKLIEGESANDDEDLIIGGVRLRVDISNILFIFSGAFQKIYDKTDKISVESLYKENVAKEFLGRMGSIIFLDKLNENDYFNILKNSSDSPLKEFIKKVEFHGDKVKIDDDTIKEIAKMSVKKSLGVNFKSIVWRYFIQKCF